MLYADMTPPIALEADGCPELTIERVLRDVVRQLYLDNEIWLHLDEVAVIEADGTLSVALPAGAEIVAVRHIRTADEDIRPRTVHDFAYVNWNDSGNPICLELNGAWTVRPAPAATTTGVGILMQLAPIYGEVEVADTVARKHRQLYEHLTLARLLTMPKKQWTNVEMAVYHGATGAHLLAEARRKAAGWTQIRTPTVRYGGI